MSRSGKDPNGQDDVDAIFGEIVADLRAEGIGARIDTESSERPSDEGGSDDARGARGEDDWLDGESDTERRDGPTETSSGGEGSRPRPAASDWRANDVGWDETMLSDSGSSLDDDDDEHFVPPEPPPLPKPSRSMGIVALFVVVGLVLLVAPHIIGIGVTVATPLGMLSLAAGLGFLLLRARDDNRPPGSDPNNGAQV